MINSFCMKTTVKDVRNMDRKTWLHEMVKSFSKVHTSECTNSQKDAWENEFDVLTKAFGQLPGSFDGIHVIFEYVLPIHNPDSVKSAEDPGVRPDVIMLSDDTVVVLEFKRLAERYNGCERQARKYRNRIQNWHAESVSMNKKTAIVFTKAENLLERRFRLYECSPEKLAEVMVEYLGDNPKTMDAEKADSWIGSEYIDRKKKAKSGKSND